MATEAKLAEVAEAAEHCSDTVETKIDFRKLNNGHYGIHGQEVLHRMLYDRRKQSQASMLFGFFETDGSFRNVCF